MAGIRRENHPAGRRKGHGEENSRDIRSPRWIFWTREGEAALGKPAGSYRTLDLTAFWQRGDGLFRPGGAGRGAASQGADPGQRSGAGGGPWKPGHDAGRRRPAGGGQHPHHPPSHRRYAPALFRVPPGGGPAAGGVGDHRRGICRGGAGTGGPAPSVGGHRRGRAGLPPGGAGVLSPSSSATPASSPAAA